jgi:hypothetical protein
MLTVGGSSPLAKQHDLVHGSSWLYPKVAGAVPDFMRQGSVVSSGDGLVLLVTPAHSSGIVILVVNGRSGLGHLAHSVASLYPSLGNLCVCSIVLAP